MAIKTKATLLSEITTLLADNVTGDITPAIMRGLSTNWVESLASALSARFAGTQESNAIETDFSSTTPGDFIPMAIVLVPDAGNEDFTVAGGVVTYTGTITKEFILTSAISGHKVGPGVANVAMKAYKNGTTPLAGQCIQEFKTGDPAGLGVSGIATLATGDTIQAKMANFTDQDNMLVGNTIVFVNEWV